MESRGTGGEIFRYCSHLAKNLAWLIFSSMCHIGNYLDSFKLKLTGLLNKLNHLNVMCLFLELEQMLAARDNGKPYPFIK